MTFLTTVEATFWKWWGVGTLSGEVTRLMASETAVSFALVGAGSSTGLEVGEGVVSVAPSSAVSTAIGRICSEACSIIGLLGPGLSAVVVFVVEGGLVGLLLGLLRGLLIVLDLLLGSSMLLRSLVAVPVLGGEVALTDLAIGVARHRCREAGVRIVGHH